MSSWWCYEKSGEESVEEDIDNIKNMFIINQGAIGLDRTDEMKEGIPRVLGHLVNPTGEKNILNTDTP